MSKKTTTDNCVQQQWKTINARGFWDFKHDGAFIGNFIELQKLDGFKDDEGEPIVKEVCVFEHEDTGENYYLPASKPITDALATGCKGKNGEESNYMLEKPLMRIEWLEKRVTKSGKNVKIYRVQVAQ